MTCDYCMWYRMEEHTTADYEGVSRTYHHVCYRESGSPQTRTVGDTISPPPACVDYFEDVERRDAS